jgi:hypothetical protein
MATTASLTTSPTTIDTGASDNVSVTNTGTVDVTIVRGPQSFTLRPTQGRVIYPEGAAVTAATVSGTGSVSYTATAARQTQAVQFAADPAFTSAFASIVQQVEGVGIAQRNASIYAANRARVTAAALPKWLAALAAVRAGTRDAKILCVGDSTTLGALSSNTSIPPFTSYPTFLATLLNTYLGVPAARGLGVPDKSGNTDARWSATGNWGWGTSGNLGWVANTCDYQLSTPFAGTLTYADSGILADKFDVYYLTGGSTGTITVTATGGTPVVQSTVASSGWGKVTVTAGQAATTNTVSITGSGNNCHITGVEPYLSTTRKVRVGIAGVGSARTAGWTTNPTTFGGVMGIKQYAPDLTIIMLGINDATDGVAAGTYGTNIGTLATAAAVSGDVILMSMIPTDSSINAGANATNEPGYVSQLAGLTSYSFVDLFTRAGSATAYQNLGFVSADKIHGTDAGYKDIAAMVATGLLGL